MASTCFNRWVKYKDSKGNQKWVNEGPAPDGACPSCSQSQYPTAGTWNGYSAACQNGNIVKMVADGSGGMVSGDVIRAVGTPQATQACNGSQYIGLPGPISQYFP